MSKSLKKDVDYFARMVSGARELIQPITKRNMLAIIFSNLFWMILCTVIIIRTFSKEKSQ